MIRCNNETIVVSCVHSELFLFLSNFEQQDFARMASNFCCSCGVRALKDKYFHVMPKKII